MQLKRLNRDAVPRGGTRWTPFDSPWSLLTTLCEHVARCCMFGLSQTCSLSFSANRMLRGKQTSRHFQNLSLELPSHGAQQGCCVYQAWVGAPRPGPQSVSRTNLQLQPTPLGRKVVWLLSYKTHCSFFTPSRRSSLRRGNGALTAQEPDDNSKSNSLTPLGYHSQFAARPPAPVLIYSTQHPRYQCFTQGQADTNLWEETARCDSGWAPWSSEKIKEKG